MFYIIEENVIDENGIFKYIYEFLYNVIMNKIEIKAIFIEKKYLNDKLEINNN